MSEFQTMQEQINKFAIRNNLQLIRNTNNGFDFQIIFENKDLKVEFLRERGEFSIYFKFNLINSKRELYSLNIISKIISKKNIRNFNYSDKIIFFEENILKFFDFFSNKHDELDITYDEIFNKRFDW